MDYFEELLNLYFLPMQSDYIFWVGLTIINLRTENICKVPLKSRGLLKIVQENPLLCLEIELGTETQKFIKYLAGVPESFEGNTILFNKFESLFLYPQEINEISLNYLGRNNSSIVYCIIRGTFKSILN